MNRTLVFFLAVLLLAAGGLSIVMAVRHMRHSAEELARLEAERRQAEVEAKLAGPPLTDFQLTDTIGREFDSESLRGKVWVASFFFSTCPASCRQQNLQIAELHREFAEQGVHFVSITCDPETDTPGVLAQYAAMFNADPNLWHFLTGDLEYITRVGADVFGVPVAPKGHSEKLILVDQGGNRRGYFSWQNQAELSELRETITGLSDGSIAPIEHPSGEEGAPGDAPEADTARNPAAATSETAAGAAEATETEQGARP